MDDLEELRLKVALSCRVLALLGLVKEGNGHVSARIPGTDQMLIRGRGQGESGLLFTEPRDILRTDLDGTILDQIEHVGIPQEFSIHGELLKSRPEVGCVVHAHPPGILLCGLTKQEFKPIFAAYDPSAMKVALDGVPVYPRAITVTSPGLAKGLLEVMEGHDVCLMYGHGITAVGASIEEATTRAIKLESLARITWHATAQGPVGPVSQEDLDYYAERPGAHRGSTAVWRYYLQLLDQKGLLIRP
jgi:ribulose-5-phosphate 4-epimerase/fuculose-1-phosphate aldolase